MVIPVEGKGKIDKPVVVFRGLQIPTYFIFDGDGQYKGTKKEKDVSQQNINLMRLAGDPSPQAFPGLTVKDSWACF